MCIRDRLPQGPEDREGATSHKGGGKKQKIKLSADENWGESKRQRSEADWYGTQANGNYETTRRRAAQDGWWEEEQAERVPEKYITDDPGVNPALDASFALPPNWPPPKGSDPDMIGRGKNKAKKRQAVMEGSEDQGDGSSWNPGYEVNTDPSVPDDPVTWHNYLFQRRNTPKGWVVSYFGWKWGWQWVKIPTDEDWDGWIEGWRRDGKKWAFGGHGRNPETGEWVQICEEQATKLNGVGLPTGSASNQLHMVFRCEGPGCKVVYLSLIHI